MLVNILLVCVLVVLFSVLLYAIRCLIRNHKVFKFRMKLLDIIFLPAPGLEDRIEVYQKVTYMEMLNSFKPLVLESFYSEEDVQILLGNK